MRESQLTGRLRLRHLREVTEAVGEEMSRERSRFHRLAREDSAPRAVSAFNLFQTPEWLADRMAAIAEIEEGHRVLEPSAGLGRLYQAIRRACRDRIEVILVENSADCCGELYRFGGGIRLVQADFLECGPDRLGGRFDRIVMNPPFKMGRDVKHIQHARGLLVPGGRLVALCANGPRQREKLQPLADSWEELPEGSFREEGTRVNAVLLTMNEAPA